MIACPVPMTLFARCSGVLLALVITGWLPTSALSDESTTAVENTIAAVVGIRAGVPASARTADSLGTEREGSGIVIDDEGLVLTIGYLILEASDVTISNSENQFIPADIVAYDYASGFGLVRASSPLGIEPIKMGNSSNLASGDAVLIISYIGPDYMQTAKVVDVREFPGYWEYLMEDAIFTSPPFQGFGGAALINRDGNLVGIGSLMVGDALQNARAVPGNMFVPIDALRPIMDELIVKGRTSSMRRPWLGVYTEMDRGHLFIRRVAGESPASRAELQVDDIILAVNDQPVSDMSDFFRKVWATGPAGVEVKLTILRENNEQELFLTSQDRYEWLRLNPKSRQTTML